MNLFIVAFLFLVVLILVFSAFDHSTLSQVWSSSLSLRHPHSTTSIVTHNHHRSLVITNGGGFVQIGSDINGDVIGDGIGETVAISRDGTTLAVGAPGATGTDGVSILTGYVQIYQAGIAADGKTIWEPKGSNYILYGADTRDFFGFSISLSSDGNIIAIGADNSQSGRFGYAVVYEFDGDLWVLREGTLRGSGPVDPIGDRYGFSLSLSGDGVWLVVGAPRALGRFSGAAASGRIHLYEYNSATNEYLPETFGDEYYFSPADGAGFGDAVAISEDASIIVVGAYNFDTPDFQEAGRVFTFKNQNLLFFPFGTTITGTVLSENLGSAVAVNSNGTIIAFSSPSSGIAGFESGKVQVRTVVGETWVQLGSDIPAEAAGDGFAAALALSSDGYTLAASSYLNDGNGNNAGHARIFRFDGNDWDEVRLRREPNSELGSYDFDIDGVNPNDALGKSISITGNGDRIVVGAEGHDHNGIDGSGEVQVWGQTQFPTFSPIKNALPQVPEPASFATSTVQDGGGDSDDIGVLATIWQFVRNATSSLLQFAEQPSTHGGN